MGLASTLPAEDAWVVQRLKRAGAVVLGKTNMGEGADPGHCFDLAAACLACAACMQLRADYSPSP